LKFAALLRSRLDENIVRCARAFRSDGTCSAVVMYVHGGPKSDATVLIVHSFKSLETNLDDLR